MLTRKDPNPVEFFPSSNSSQLLLVCDHAGCEVPIDLKHQLPSSDDMKRHIAWDVNARSVALIVARQLSAPLVAQRYSRLVIDANRPLSSSELIPLVSDETVIPFNQNLGEEERKNRIESIFQPYHKKIQEQLDNIDSSPQFLVAVHSFTPQLRKGNFREYHVDLISRTCLEFVKTFQNRMQSNDSHLKIGFGDVFAIDTSRDFTIPHHGESRNIYNMSIEIRNDLLKRQSDIEYWGTLIADCLRSTIATLTVNLDSAHS